MFQTCVLIWYTNISKSDCDRGDRKNKYLYKFNDFKQNSKL